MDVDQFFMLKGNTPLWESVYFQVRQVLFGSACFPALFFLFPRLELHPLFCTVSLCDWSWRNMLSRALSVTIMTGLRFMCFRGLMAQLTPRFPSLQTPHTLQQVFVFAHDFESQWVSRFCFIPTFVPLRSSAKMSINAPGGVTPEHLLVQDLAASITRRLFVGARALAREYLWPHLFPKYRRRHVWSPAGVWYKWVTRLIKETSVSLCAYGVATKVAIHVPWLNRTSPLLVYHLFRFLLAPVIDAQVSKLCQGFLTAPKLPVRSFSQQLEVAKKYIDTVRIPPIAFEEVRSMINSMITIPHVTASMKLSMAETVWAMQVMEQAYANDMVTHDVLEHYGSRIQQFRKGAADGTDELISSMSLKRQLSDLTAETSMMLSEEQCSICLGGINPGQRSAMIPDCGHTFHASCLVKWLWKNPSCPMCRGELDTEHKRPPLSVLFTHWIRRFDLPHSCDSEDWAEIKSECELRNIPVDPAVFDVFDKQLASPSPTIFDLGGVAFWGLDFYPPDDDLRLDIFSRGDDCWRDSAQYSSIA